MVLADLVQPSSDRSGSNAPPKRMHAIGDRPPRYKPLDVERLKKTAPDFTVTFTEDKNGFYINGRKFALDASPMTSARVGTVSALAYCQRNRRTTSFPHPPGPLPGLRGKWCSALASCVA